MTKAEFWKLIEASGRMSKGDVDKQGDLLREALNELKEKEIFSFERHLRLRLRQAYTFDVMAAAFIIHSYVSDDVFEEFRAWLVAQGRRRFEEAIRSPESIVDFLERDNVDAVAGDAILLAASRAYSDKTGKDDFFAKAETIDNPQIRQDWPETRAKFRERYPVLYDTFWNQERIAQLHEKQ